MKAVHVTTLHPASDVRIWLKECRTLARQGYEVVLCAPVSAGFERDGVVVKPVGVTTISAGIANLVPRLTKVFMAVKRERADLVHLHDAELIPVGLALKPTGARVVLDAHEDTPLDVLTLGDRTGPAVAAEARVWRAAETVAAAAFDGVVAATPEIARKFPTKKTVLVRNFPLAEESASFAGRVPYADRPPELLYLGQLSARRGLYELAEAMSRVTTDGARLVLAGRVHPHEPDLLTGLGRTLGWERVSYDGLLDRAGVAAALGRARLGLVLLPPRRAYVESLPVKLFEYMAAGLPVVASDFPRWREIVEPARCGLLVDPDDASAVAGAIDRLLGSPDEAQAMGLRGLKAFEEQYTWEAETESLLGLYERLLGR